MGYKVPSFDPRADYLRLKSEVHAGIIDCLPMRDLIYRQQLRDVGEKPASCVGVKYAVHVNSGYHPLHFSWQCGH